MKKITIFFALLLVGSISYSQGISSVDVGKRKEYMMKTYKINSLKADKYEQDVLPALERENEQLKNKKISSAKFKEEQNKLYKKYGVIVSNVFYNGKYKKWSSCTQELERYHILSEMRLIPYEKMRTLDKAEGEWKKERDQMWAGAGDELKKIEDNDKMLTNLNSQIRQILGLEDGDWYIAYKDMAFRAIDNMDKYGATYNEGYQIAKIETTSSKQRKQVYETRSKNRNDKLQEIEDHKLKSIKKAVPAQVAERWAAVNNSYMDYTLTKRYKLDKAKIAQFKNAYNVYAIEEYKILHEQKKLSTAEKIDRLTKANDTFCEKVRPLFNGSSYNKWMGKRMHDFKQKMEQKNKNK